MPLLRSAILSSTGLAALLALTVGAAAQAPWQVTIRPSTPSLQTGVCTPVYLDLLNASGRESPRNPAGMKISISDFDMSVTGGAVVGRYNGASAWTACACPGSAGASATITANYPAGSLAEPSKVKGVAFQTAITVPVVAGTGSGVPIGCEKLKTTSAPAGGSAPWSVTLTTTLSAIPIGTCAAIGIDLRDATGKEYPRNPSGILVSLADFDMAVTGSGVAGVYNGTSLWSACGCQSGAAGSLATIVATYPATGLAPAARVPGVAFRSSMTIPLSKAMGSADPPACSSVASRTIATGVTMPAPVGTPVPVQPATTQPVATQPVATQPVPVSGAEPIATAPVTTKTAAPTAVPTAPATTKTQVSTEPVAVLKGPSPTFVTVTATPISATLKWQPMAGVASYVVTRQQANLAPVVQTLPGTNTGMFDSGLYPATAYTWTIRALQADGSEGSTTVTSATPPAVNPSGFAAQQTGDGKVQLSWQPVAGASYYVVLGPGSSFGGVIVSGATGYTVTGAPVGAQTWAVGSYYDPGPAPSGSAVGPNARSTPADQFPRALLTVVGAQPLPSGIAVSPTARLTSFDPKVHGFKFVNSFANSFIGPPIGMTTSGLCGGMSYTVLDYYNNNMTITRQETRPANSTTIQSYLYLRQVTSLLSNVDKWGEVSLNFFGDRTVQFFNWGLTARLLELKSFIDRGVPVPLGLKGTGGLLDKHDHQVLAIGYDMGRYAGNLGDYKGDFKIYILDPNYPTRTLTLVPDTAKYEFYEVEEPDNRWRTYFVDGKYLPMVPPAIVDSSYPSDGLVHELELDFFTGADDMRGGADHVDLRILLSDRTSQYYPNISLGGRWLPNYMETVRVYLSTPVPKASIVMLEITTNATGGLNGDNWDLTLFQGYAIGGGFKHVLLSSAAGPYRFDGSRIPILILVK